MKMRWSKFIITTAVISLLPIMAFAQSVSTPVGTVGDINAIMQNIRQSVPGVVQLAFGACYVVGVWQILRAVYKLKRYAQGTSMMSQEASLAKPVITMVIGIGCIWLPQLMDTITTTVWAYGNSSIIAYPQPENDAWVNVVDPLIDVVRAFGLISIIRGWTMLARLGGEGGSQPGTTGKSLMHIFGGIFAWNIVGVWTVIQNTLGIT